MKKHHYLYLIIYILLNATDAQATPYYYRFQGTIQSAASYNSSYPVSSLKAEFGKTEVDYLFEVDFNRNTSTYSNSAAVWNYFYGNLSGKGYMEDEIGSVLGHQSSFNGDFFSIHDVGQLGGGHGVRITAYSSQTLDWRVQDWEVGDQLNFTDLAVPPGGGGAVYYFGNVNLVSIQPVPEPASGTLIGLGAVAVCLQRRLKDFQKRHHTGLFTRRQSAV